MSNTINKLSALICGLTFLPPLTVTAQNVTVSGSGIAKAPALYEILPDGNIVPAAANPEHQKFKVSVAPRDEKRDSYIAFGLGANAFQQGDVQCRDGNPGDSVDGQIKSNPGWVANFRGGHTWQLGDAKDNLLAFSLEGELIFTGIAGSSFKGKKTGGGESGSPPAVPPAPPPIIPVTPTAFSSYASNSVWGAGEEVSSGKYDLYVWALMVNPILRFQLGKLVPYVGVGAGGALVLAADPVDGSMGTRIWSDSRYGAAFAFQGMAGADYFVSEDWSLFLEYKYFGLVGLNLNQYVDGKKTNDDLKTQDIFGNHLLVFGARWHF